LEHAAESTKPEGLGLGLSIVREIADMHSASLHFERLAKGGVRAELILCLAPYIAQSPDRRGL